MQHSIFYRSVYLEGDYGILGPKPKRLWDHHVDFRADPSRPTMSRARDEGVGEVGEAGKNEGLNSTMVQKSSLCLFLKVLMEIGKDVSKMCQKYAM